MDCKSLPLLEAFGTFNIRYSPYYMRHCKTVIVSDTDRIDGCIQGGLHDTLQVLTVLAVQEYPRVHCALRKFLGDWMPHHVVVAPFTGEEGPAVLYDQRRVREVPNSAAFHYLHDERDRRTCRGFTVVRLEFHPESGFGGGFLTFASCHIPFSTDAAYLVKTLRHVASTAVGLSGGRDGVVIAGDFNFDRDSLLGQSVLAEALPSSEWSNWLSEVGFTTRTVDEEIVCEEFIMFKNSPWIAVEEVAVVPENIEELLPHASGVPLPIVPFISNHCLCVVRARCFTFLRVVGEVERFVKAEVEECEIRLSAVIASLISSETAEDLFLDIHQLVKGCNVHKHIFLLVKSFLESVEMDREDDVYLGDGKFTERTLQDIYHVLCVSLKKFADGLQVLSDIEVAGLPLDAIFRSIEAQLVEARCTVLEDIQEGLMLKKESFTVCQKMDEVCLRAGTISLSPEALQGAGFSEVAERLRKVCTKKEWSDLVDMCSSEDSLVAQQGILNVVLNECNWTVKGGIVRDCVVEGQVGRDIDAEAPPEWRQHNWLSRIITLKDNISRWSNGVVVLCDIQGRAVFETHIHDGIVALNIKVRDTVQQVELVMPWHLQYYQCNRVDFSVNNLQLVPGTVKLHQICPIFVDTIEIVEQIKKRQCSPCRDCEWKRNENGPDGYGDAGLHLIGMTTQQRNRIAKMRAGGWKFVPSPFCAGATELLLFHGTSRSSLDSIDSKGLEGSIDGLCGGGLYCTRDPFSAHHFAHEKDPNFPVVIQVFVRIGAIHVLQDIGSEWQRLPHPADIGVLLKHVSPRQQEEWIIRDPRRDVLYFSIINIS